MFGIRFCPYTMTAVLHHTSILIIFNSETFIHSLLQKDTLYFIFYFNKRSMYIQVRIQDLVKGGAPGAEAESCRHSEAESCVRSKQFAAGVQGP